MEFKLWFFENADPTAVLRSFFPDLDCWDGGCTATVEDKTVSFKPTHSHGVPVLRIDFRYRNTPQGVTYDNGNSNPTGRGLTGETVRFSQTMKRLMGVLSKAGVGVIAYAEDQQRLRVYYNQLTQIGFRPFNDGGQVVYMPPGFAPPGGDYGVGREDLPPGFKWRW